MFFQIRSGLEPGGHANAKPLFCEKLGGGDSLWQQPSPGRSDKRAGNWTIRSLRLGSIFKISLAQKKIFERSRTELLRHNGGVRLKGFKKGSPTLFWIFQRFCDGNGA